MNRSNILVGYFPVCLLVCLAALSLLTFFVIRQDYHDNNVPKNDFYACDFHMRMNEIDCIKNGINPYDVWSMQREVLPYVPNTHHELWTPERCEFINAYAPWEYIMLMPLSYLPRKLAWSIYNYGQLVALVLIAFFAYRFGHEYGNHGVHSSAFALMILIAAKQDLFYGNFCIYLTLSLFALAWALTTRHDIIAGIIWSVIMIKPQIGLLIAIPLIIQRKILTCAIATSICILSTCIASLMCGTPFLDLLTQASLGSAHWYHGCGLLPYNIYLSMLRRFSGGLLISAASAIGFLICIITTLILKNERNFLIVLVPATICGLTCNYSNDYNYCVCGLLLVAISFRLKRSESIITHILLSLLIMFSVRAYDCLTFVITMAHGILGRIGIWPWGPLSESNYLTVSCWNATCLLILTIWFANYWRRCQCIEEPIR